MIKSLTWVTLGLGLLTTGCATMDTEDYGYKDGWRKARVVEVGDAASPMKASQKDCRAEMGPNAPYKRFAVVSYSFGGNPKLKAKQISAVPDTLDLKVDDFVYVNLRDCQAPLRKRELPFKNP